MKNLLLIASTLSTISCSSSTPMKEHLLSKNSYSSNVSEHGVSGISNSENSTFANLLGDTAITIRVKKKFLDDNSINSLNIRVITVNGKVKLVGTVPDATVKQRAIAIAKNVKGVTQVEDDLAINNKSLIRAASSDAIITSKIKLSYIDDQDINSSDIKVKTVNGNVSLSGSVANQSIKNRAIIIALKTVGVNQVNNDIKIAKTSLVKNLAVDSAITSIIKMKYFQDEILSGLDIHVKTINHEVTLEGIVKNSMEMDRAIDLARLTNGVKVVHSKLRIQKK